MSELKPCPCCNSKATEYNAGYRSKWVRCDKCGLTATSVDKWNTRTPQSEWISVDKFKTDKAVLVYALCNDIVNQWVEILKINSEGEITFPHGTAYPALVDSVMPIELPLPPQ